MADFETICEDVKAWTRYDCGDDGDIVVYRRCPECGRYLKKGEVLTNMAGDAKVKGWICKKDGEVEPFWTRD
jgi:hypothetical protein